jgi:sterol desaturase/sphingolipid hydroxylase (fatty acid hydroxylase superfamily)
MFILRLVACAVGLACASVLLGQISWNTRFKTTAPFVIAYAAATTLLAWATAVGPTGPVCVSFAVSLAIGSLVEYAVHRWLLHWPWPRGRHEQLVYDLHENHHDDPRDRSIQPVSLAVSVPVYGLATFFALEGAGAVGAAMMAGLIAFYGYYEWVHHATHNLPARTPWLRQQQRLHRLHHFRDARVNYGVTNPLWDLVFGTYCDPRPSAADRRRESPARAGG